MADVARIKHILGVEGVFNVVCDIPDQSVIVSSSLSPRVIVSLIQQAMGSAHIVNYVDPLQPTFVARQERARDYDDSYSYNGFAPNTIFIKLANHVGQIGSNSVILVHFLSLFE